MKQISLFALFFALSSSAFSRNKKGTFTGEIMDKQCAQTGSHANMMKTENAKRAKESALPCVKNRGTFALLDSETKKVYSIGDKQKVREYAGERQAKKVLGIDGIDTTTYGMAKR